MKKIIAVCTVLLCVFATAVADETKDALDLIKAPQDNTTRTIVPEDQHVTNKTAKVQMEYTPLLDEVRVYYSCLAVSFDQGEAMNTVLACLKDFEEQNQYYSYKYLKKDSVRYYKDDHNLNMAMYESYVKFSR